jgi:hypothetical protein
MSAPPYPRRIADALRLGAEALRADAESAAPGEIAADPEAAARDLAAAAMLDLAADNEDARDLLANRWAQPADDGDPESAALDRIAAGRGTFADLATALRGAVDGERLEIAAAACAALADAIERRGSRAGGVGNEVERHYAALAEAVRRDWTAPAR